ncbi:hypothetical protein CFK41_16000 [Brachybacterium ginsengisoli]|uniref:histidine kinase n=1 Tax=Brachybacterium ginsengisoli TaxID=1331682 RepID=A0A291H0X7_9MICO|nr:histidine kinase [Brachybacterium ginsengisoli]ATG56113.1 hypothetical protein CFK41_16000 [Brachybacterium ginsengisoli]
MPDPVPFSAAAPSVRSLRHWGIAAAQSLLAAGTGLLMFLVAFGMLLEEFADHPPQGLMALAAVDALLGATASLAVGPLRFLPPGRLHSAAHLLLAAMAGFSVWAAPAAGIALYRIGLRRRAVLGLGAVLLVTGSSLAQLSADTRFRGEEPDWAVLAAVGVMMVLALLPLLFGHVVATRRELLSSLRERAASAERERETAQRERAADEARVRAEERTALARDMHDSISHHLAAISLYAGAMAYREDLPPEALRRTAGTVRDAAQQANRELRMVLTTLRTTEGDQPLATAPTLVGIVERGREEGRDIELEWVGVSEEDLTSHDRSAVVALARILSELTLNAAKHAPGAPLRVSLRAQGGQVLLRARNPLPAAPASPPSTGHGLLGVQERARLLGGDARWRAADGTFEVEAWMPW